MKKKEVRKEEGSTENLLQLVDDEAAAVFDMKALQEDAAEGAKAAAYLFDHRADDWNRHFQIIRGLRGLRDLVRHKTGTRKATDFAFRQEMGRVLSQKQYSAYDRLGGSPKAAKAYRGHCAKLMDTLEDIDDWYKGEVHYQGYPVTDENRWDWKTPQTIAKHCPPQLLEGGESKVAKQTSKPKPKWDKPKPPVAIEIERLKDLVLKMFKAVTSAPDLETAKQQIMELITELQPKRELPEEEEEIEV